MWRLILFATIMVAVLAAVAAAIVLLLPPLVIRYRLSDTGIQTRVLGVRVSSIPYRELLDPADIRVATYGELFRTGEILRFGVVGQRGWYTRLWGPVVVIQRAAGGVAVPTPPRIRTRWSRMCASTSCSGHAEREWDAAGDPGCIPFRPSYANMCVVAAGARLIAAADDFARLHDALDMHLTTALHREEAHRFYEGLGFDRKGGRYTRSTG